MTETEIKSKLDELAELQALRNVAQLDRQRLLNEAIPAEIKARIASLEAECAGKTETANERIAALEATIKQAIIAHGASVKSATLHAVFAKGRISWDAKSLDGYAIAHPELLAFRKEGEPTVSIRSAK